MIALAEWIRDRSLGGRVFFCNSGAEASEAALKLARKHGGPDRPEVVALVDGFHGRTYGALSLTGQPGKQDPFRPLVPGVRHVDRDDLGGPRGRGRRRAPARSSSRSSRARSASTRCRPRCCGSRASWPTATAPCSLIDEIQTGLARTGPLWAYQDVGVVPDVMMLAKSLGGGVPIGAVVARPEHDAVLQPGDHGSTFAGGPLACAAALASCAVLDDPELQQSRARQGRRPARGARGPGARTASPSRPAAAG